MIEKFKNKKFRAVVGLIFWTVFISVVYGVLMYENKKLDDYEKEYNAKYNFVVDFDTLKTALLNESFDYLYIVMDDGLTTYQGTKDKTYSGVEKIGNTSKNYENVQILNKKYRYLDIKTILDLYNDNFTKEKHTFLYEKDDFYVKIRVSIDNIINIEVNDEGIIYQLEISNLNGFDVKGSE